MTLEALAVPGSELSQLVVHAKEYAKEALSPATRRAYESDWRAFEDWAIGVRLPALPTHPETIVLYITHLADAGRKVAGIERALAAIEWAHRKSGVTSERHHVLVREYLKAVRRRIGTSQTKKAALTPEIIRAMCNETPSTIVGVRDRAILTLGFASALRRSELCGLDVADLTWSRDGLAVYIKKSKTDQTGEGRSVGIPYGSVATACPVRSVQEWLYAAKITEGPVFRAINWAGNVSPTRLTDRTIARLVQIYCSKLGLDASQYAGHSLRSGLATSAAYAGKSLRSIMAQTGHKSTDVAMGYIRAGSLFQDNAATGLL